MTAYWMIDPALTGEQDGRAIEQAAAALREGGTVAFPTETVYGLGADARNTDAVRSIFTAKGRPSDNPLIVHIADRSQLDELVSSPDETVCRLLDAFWPGPLTVVLPAKPGVLSPLVTAGLSTVGVRMPDHVVARALIAASGCPLAGPSANRSGKPSPTRAEHVRADLDGRIDGIVDAGPTGVGLESTVVAISGGEVHILRPGGVTAAQLQAALPGAVIVDGSRGHKQEEAPRAPGMKYTHYAPQGRMVLVEGGDSARIAACMQRLVDEASAAGSRTGMLVFREELASRDLSADCVLELGSRADLTVAARTLYDALRAFDDAGVTFIAAAASTGDGLGEALRNRMSKAAGDCFVQA
jgi:L-threonylcarbamoyladenylate synthase